MSSPYALSTEIVSGVAIITIDLPGEPVNKFNGWTAKVSLPEGLARTAEWFRSRMAPSEDTGRG
jgi:hypothetical protein